MIRNILKKFRLFINKLGSNRRNNDLVIKNPTIISNNCWGGIVSQYLGIQYFSLTVGLYFFSDDYIKFLKNFKYYINCTLYFIEPFDSKYYDELKKKGHEKSIIGKLDDVEIVFLHYSSKKEAKIKWDRRVKRINYDYIIFKFCNQNLCTDEHIDNFDKLPYKNKICLSSKKYPRLNSVIFIEKQKGLEEVEKDYYVFHKYLNIIDYINNIEKEDWN